MMGPSPYLVIRFLQWIGQQIAWGWWYAKGKVKRYSRWLINEWCWFWYRKVNHKRSTVLAMQNTGYFRRGDKATLSSSEPTFHKVMAIKQGKMLVKREEEKIMFGFPLLDLHVAQCNAVRNTLERHVSKKKLNCHLCQDCKVRKGLSCVKLEVAGTVGGGGENS